MGVLVDLVFQAVEVASLVLDYRWFKIDRVRKDISLCSTGKHVTVTAFECLGGCGGDGKESQHLYSAKVRHEGGF